MVYPIELEVGYHCLGLHCPVKHVECIASRYRQSLYLIQICMYPTKSKKGKHLYRSNNMYNIYNYDLKRPIQCGVVAVPEAVLETKLCIMLESPLGLNHSQPTIAALRIHYLK